ncbi:MAG: glutamine amidotransferase, partial [Actinomycetes bacterium]
GYENHSGMTRLGPHQEPLGRVLRGTGTSSHRRTEGAMTGSAIGTYLHGPVLARNPALADHLIRRAISRHDTAAAL